LIAQGNAEKIKAYLKANPNVIRYTSFQLLRGELDSFGHLFSTEDYEALALLMGR